MSSVLLRWLLTVPLAVIGGFVIAANDVIFVRGLVFRRFGSWVPLLGGAACAAALLLVPVPDLHWWWWVPLLVDWGSLPGITHTAVYYLARSRARTGWRQG